MKIIQEPQELQNYCLQLRRDNRIIGFVPTMGYLHDGHLSLMKQCRSLCDVLIVSIYVNPLQFGPNEDLDRYPRDLDGDLQKCTEENVDVVFTPREMYHPNHSTYVQVENLDKNLCGSSREGHFRGVTTVVARLFGLVQPQIAVFGEKDFQQLAIVRRMVQDLAMPIEIIAGKIVREPSGLAMSSRNRYLQKEEKIQAQSISESLFWAQKYCSEQSTSIPTNILIEEIQKRLRVDSIDYISIVDPISLETISHVEKNARCAIAVWVGNTRLIDNVLLELASLGLHKDNSVVESKEILS